MRETRRAGTAGALSVALAAAGIAAGIGAGAQPSAGAATVPTNNQLSGVTCTSPANCFAVGTSTIPSAVQDKTLVERWNGTRWSIVRSPNPPGTTFDRLAAVTCASAADCFAVGEQVTNTPHTRRTLIEHWNGTAWSVVVSPNPPTATSESTLRGVSCTSSTFCVAVGVEYVTKQGQFVDWKSLVERWNGRKWAIVATPHVSGTSLYELDAVSCTSTRNCTAVGAYGSPNHEPGSTGVSTLVEKWNGTAWSMVTSPNPGMGEGAYLSAVSCTSAPNCLAAGQYALGGVGRPAVLSQRWNGAKWAIIDAKLAPSRSYNQFNGVSCTSTTNCMATGYYTRPQKNELGTLVERWNGKTWTVVTSPNVAGSYSSLGGVACWSTTSCVSVGTSYATTAGPYRTLVERWNGAKWAIVASPNP